MQNKLRNIAIIAHVDHGKTTLIDKLLQQSGTLQSDQERILDSNDLERERGITILAKNTAIDWQDHRINIIDTPGHADFGGEVERILSMVDSVLLLVDAVEGPMPQTRFVTAKAFAHNLNPILVINKIDRPNSRPDWVMDQVFELFDSLGASDAQLDFPVIYASALQGFASLEAAEKGTDMAPLLDAIIEKVPPPDVDPSGPLQMQISALDYSSYVGTIGVGRIQRGSLNTNDKVTIVDPEGKTRTGRVLQVLGYHGLQRQPVKSASAGDIIAISGIEPLHISDTLCDPEHPAALPPLTVDEPTVHMTFQVNTSPFAGREGKFLTSRQIRDRLHHELSYNVALRVKDTDDPDRFWVAGRGELHLSILLETMRREGFELAVSRPEVILKEIDGQTCEPYEQVIIEVKEAHQGAVMEKLGERQAELKDMQRSHDEWVRLEYIVPSRGLFGFRNEFMTATSGTGLLEHVFDHYGPMKPGQIGGRLNGVLISNMVGKATAFSLANLQSRGRLLIGPQTEVYEGMLVGIHARDNDLVVNVVKGKKLTNVRASGKDDQISLEPHIDFTLEQALEFINDDELVELTPQSLRLRKKRLLEHERKRASREA